MKDENCCVVSCESPLDQAYWDAQYKANTPGWDLGKVSPPIKDYIDSLTDKSISILIPGCGNTYEAEYLLEQGFSNLTVIDIAPTLVESLNQKFADNPNIKIVLGDFFEHHGQYDLIIEQTFFCALPPALRRRYVWKMHGLLSDHGKLAGLLFNRAFEAGPPFGGSKHEYEQLFKDAFSLNSIETSKNSVPQRADSELFIEFEKNNTNKVSLYSFEGITCTGCMDTVTKKFSAIDGVLNVSMNNTFSEVLLVSKKEIPLQLLQDQIAYDAKYHIKKINP